VSRKDLKKYYPVFSQSILPVDEDLLERLFRELVRAGTIATTWRSRTLENVKQMRAAI
jgi:hypothetical protein